MNTRRLILIGLVLLIALGIGNFVINSVQTRSQLALITSKEAAAQETGVQKLMARGILFDALQGGAPQDTRLGAIGALQRLAAGGKNAGAFSELLQMLKDPDTESVDLKTHPVRDAAKDAVAAVGVAYPALLLDAAKDPDANIKDQSRVALKKIGAPLEKEMAGKLGDAALRAPLGDILASIGPETISLITPYLQPPLLKTDAKPDDLAKAKIELIETLGKFKTPEAATPIVAFKDDADPNVRRSVVTSLANIADPVGAPVLIAALNNPATDASARAAAAGALGGIATPEANAAMVHALGDYDLSVADAAAAGLRRAGDKAGAEIAAALQNPDLAVRSRAATAAGGMRSSSLAATALRDAEPRVRVAGAAALGDVLFHAATVQADISALANAAEPKTQDTAYSDLVKDGATGDLHAVGAPPAALAHAVSVLEARANAETVPAKQKTIQKQLAALTAAPPVSALAPVNAASVAPLVAALGDADGDVAQTAVRALGRLGAPAVAPLAAQLASPNDALAYNASQALSTISGGAAVDPLIAAAQPGKPGARWAAITLGLLGDIRAEPALSALSKSGDSDTAYAAAAALARIRPGASAG